MSKVTGDAGEWYTLSQFAFAGVAAAKMPDNWKEYDLILDFEGRLSRVSVKTRRRTEKWSSAPWFNFDDRQNNVDIIVFVLKADTSLESWVVPFELALEHARLPSPTARDRWSRDMHLATLQSELSCFKDRWDLPTRFDKFVERPVTPDIPSHAEQLAQLKAGKR
ncbi:hypothetical protein [Lysobacter sp. H23M47]|uniref:hypothetical protein n=1 Tax=Lysobacter sp. H23M47 TaxID=2781024 RepID=UPI00187F8AA1|nr:hypothetical protein [Lysobacter sp. H23M47]QOW24500.1 hypothetical protein INQ43_12630 [Lysobacter sp. H23M47]